MASESDRVIVIGAGPVGLCLSLALAQADVRVTLIEQLSDHNFLDQVPRAGSNHPATLEMFDRIGLYRRIEPRGIIAPIFHYWDREHGELIAARARVRPAARARVSSSSRIRPPMPRPAQPSSTAM